MSGIQKINLDGAKQLARQIKSMGLIPGLAIWHADFDMITAGPCEKKDLYHSLSLSLTEIQADMIFTVGEAVMSTCPLGNDKGGRDSQRFWVLLYYGGPFRYTPGLYEDLNLSQD